MHGWQRKDPLFRSSQRRPVSAVARTHLPSTHSSTVHGSLSVSHSSASVHMHVLNPVHSP